MSVDKLEPALKNATHKILSDIVMQTDHIIPVRRSNSEIIFFETWVWRMVDFTVPPDHRVKTKESKKRNDYLDLTRELRTLRNMMGTVIPIVISALGTVPKGLERRLEKIEIRRRAELHHCWGQPEYWGKSWRLEKSCCQSNWRERPSANVIYSYTDSCRKNHNDTIIKTREDFFKKIYLSLYL